ncbi:MAG: tetratricopeptide repeat protein [Pyrinomonadaceae bacterium]
MKRDFLLVLAIVLGLSAAALTTRWNDAHRRDLETQFAEEPLYLNGPAMKRITLAFNGVAADWYWMRSLQYLGRKIIKYEDTHAGQFDLHDLSSLDLRLLPSLLRMATTLDPQFLEPYYYGALILPDLNQDEAISLLNYGIAANPYKWRLHQHLGYIYWRRGDYHKASDVYAAGAKIAGAPPWMLAMSARMKAEGGAGQAAREMYAHLSEASDDLNVKRMVEKQLMRLDSLEERDRIRRVLSDYRARTGNCVATWKEVSSTLRSAGLRIDGSGAPSDPGNTPYRLVKDGCDVDLDENSPVPHR